jgi:hypothetical protein
MKKNLLKNSFLSIGLLLGTVGLSQTTVFNYTGTLQTYTVPAGVNSIQIESTGAKGGQGTTMSTGAGGNGAEMIGTFNVTPGQVLNILVGQQGGGSTYVGGGGGGSFVWDNATSTLLIAAGGGGGGGYTDAGGTYTVGINASITESGTNGNNFSNGGGVSGNGGTTPTAIYWASGGAGWNTNGANGTTHSCTFNSTGGQTPLSGGAGGIGGGDGLQYGGYGGGGGGNARCGAVGGGGGGGYSGGGPGGEVVGNQYNAGGGGGSFNGGTDQVNTPGVGTGNGIVSITVLCSGLNTTVSDNSVCIGESVTLSASSIGSGVVSWDNGITDGVSFTPALGTTTYTATSTDPNDCDFSVDITVNPLPTVNAGANANVCEGDSIMMSGTGTATSYTWDGGIIDGDYYTPVTAGTTTFTVTGEILATGCVATDAIDVTYIMINEAVSFAGTTLTSAQVGATYQWVECPAYSAISGATSQSYTLTQDGNYAVIVTLNGCADTSACQAIAGLGFSVFDEVSVSVLPNPNNGEFQLNIGQQLDGTLQLVSLDGKLIHTEAINQRTLVKLSFNELETGVYILVLNTELGATSLQVVIQ